MSSAESFLSERIGRSGPVTFHEFMEAALYHPEFGYYRRARDPFGREGDFYTAEQLQPVFGILIAARIRYLFEEMGRPPDFRVVELGAGRGEMAKALSSFHYVSVEIDDPMPERFTGVVFSNEFFDALPVHVAVHRGTSWNEMRISRRDQCFAWEECGEAPEEVRRYLDRYAGSPEEGNLCEANLDALRWLEEIAARLERGYVFTIDYGYTARELIRFPQGTLMSYHRHTAAENVLSGAGERDITAHVNFTSLRDHGERSGLETIRFESLARTLLDAGEADQFAAALSSGEEAERMRRTLQLKTLLYGMGETFRTLLQKKAAK